MADPYGPQRTFAPAAELSPADQRLWATLAHLSGIAAHFVGIPLLGPLVIFLVFKDRGLFVRRQAAEALNFQILVTAIYVAGVVLTVLTAFVGGIVIFPLLGIVLVVAVIFMVIAAVAANQGVDHRYPITWRLVH